MSLQDWANNGWLRAHQSSPQEIADLFAIVARDLSDAGGSISADWRFGIAYNAALKLCTILLHATVDDIWRYAELCRVARVMYPYLEALD